jgi:hypothetical protein
LPIKTIEGSLIKIDQETNKLIDFIESQSREIKSHKGSDEVHMPQAFVLHSFHQL